MSRLWEVVGAVVARFERMPGGYPFYPILLLFTLPLLAVGALVDSVGGGTFSGRLWLVSIGGDTALILLYLGLDVGIERLYTRLPDPSGERAGAYTLAAALLAFVAAVPVYATADSVEPALVFVVLGVLAVGRYVVDERAA